MGGQAAEVRVSAELRRRSNTEPAARRARGTPSMPTAALPAPPAVPAPQRYLDAAKCFNFILTYIAK